MKFVFTKHASEKFGELEKLGWKVTKEHVRKAIEQPKWRGISKHGQETVIILVNKHHILRVIFNREHGRIKVVTFHVARRGRYESTL